MNQIFLDIDHERDDQSQWAWQVFISDDLAGLLFPGPSWIKFDWDSWAFSCPPVLWLMHIFIIPLPSSPPASLFLLLQYVYFIVLFCNRTADSFWGRERKMDSERNRARKLISPHCSFPLVYNLAHRDTCLCT